MIKRLLRNLRQKPKAIRDNIALSIAGIFTAVVGSFWLYNFPATHSLEATVEADDAASFSNLFSDFKDQVASLKEATQEEAGQQAMGTLDSSVSRERTDIKEFDPPVSNATTSTTSFGAATSTSPLDFSIESATTATPNNTVNSSSKSPQLEPSQSIRIVTINGSAATSASTTLNQ